MTAAVSQNTGVVSEKTENAVHVHFKAECSVGRLPSGSLVLQLPLVPSSALHGQKRDPKRWVRETHFR